MSEGTSIKPSDIKSPQEDFSRKRSLAEALVEVKNRQASRDDVVVDMKEAERARLDLLAEELQPLFDELPADNDQFEFALTNGKPPRMWIDMTAHVSMGRDRRVYRFLKDTKAGRIVLAESADMSVIADAISNYIVERVLEHQRILEGEWTTFRIAEDRAVSKERARKRSSWQSFIWFVIGFLASAAALYGWTVYGLLLMDMMK